jgi:hypothetical protein
VPSQRGRAAAPKKRPQKPLKAATRQFSAMSLEQRANALVAATGPLLELFAVVDDVFTEHDAMAADKRRMTLGRIYEQWKRTRAQLDPEFKDHDPDRKPLREALLEQAHKADRANRRAAKKAVEDGQFS